MPGAVRIPGSLLLRIGDSLKRAFAIVFVGLLTLGILVPSAAAATWALIDNSSTVGSISRNPAGTILQGPNGDAIRFFHRPTAPTGFVYSTCTPTACAAPSQLHSDYWNADGDFGHEVRRSGTEIFGCYFRDEVDHLRWFYSDDGGAGFSQGDVHPTTFSAQGCGADIVGAGQWRVAYANISSDQLWFASTNNFGVAWTYTLVTAFTEGVTNEHVVSLKAANSTHYGIVLQESGGITFCETTDSGGTWVCRSTGITSGAKPYLNYSGTTWLFSYESGGLRFARSTNGILWPTTQVTTDGSNFGRVHFQVFDATTIYAVPNGPTGASQDLGSLAVSEDLGVTWSTSTLGCASVTNEIGGSSIYVSSTGAAWTAHPRATTRGILSCHSADFLTLPPQGVAATLDLGAGNITGWAIDETGQNLLIRPSIGHTADQSVRAYDAATLALRATQTTDCNRVDGVLAHRDFLAYVHCTGASVPDTLNVRTPSLGTNVLFSPCLDCQTEITLPTLLTDSDQVGELRDLIPFPLTGETKVAGTTDTTVAFFYSDFLGHVGLAAKTYRDGTGNDREESTRVAYSADAPDQICAFPRDGNVYVVAVDAAATTRAWKATVTATSSSLTVALTTQWTSGISGGLGVACAWDKVLVVTAGGNVVALNSLTGQSLWTVTSVTTDTRGAAGSSDGLWAAYQHGSDLRVVNWTDGTLLGTAGTGTGATDKGMWMDRHGSYMWHVTDQQVNKYEIFNFTTGVPVSAGGGSQPSDPTSADPAGTATPAPSPSGIIATGGILPHDTNNPIGQAIVNFESSWGFDGSWIFGALLVGGIAWKMGRGSIFLAMLGALLGVLLAIGLGLLTEWVLFVIVFLLIVFSANILLEKKRGGAGEE